VLSGEKDFLKNQVDCFVCFVCQCFSVQLEANLSITVHLATVLLLYLSICPKKLLDFFGLNIYICSLLKIEPCL